MADHTIQTPIYMTNAEISERFYCVYCHTPNRLVNRIAVRIMRCGACHKRSYKSRKAKTNSYTVMGLGFVVTNVIISILLGVMFSTNRHSYLTVHRNLMILGAADVSVFVVGVLCWFIQKNSWSQNEYDLLVNTNRLPPKSITINSLNAVNRVIIPPAATFLKPMDMEPPPSYHSIVYPKNEMNIGNY
ncbi:hypothetical protein SNEBB_010140 [Seison nebaliae]|nr:hypothetical protein SNEBB_010140 [Seison nebaliae]